MNKKKNDEIKPEASAIKPDVGAGSINRKANDARKIENKVARDGYAACEVDGDFFQWKGYDPVAIMNMVKRLGKSKNQKWHKSFTLKKRVLMDSELDRFGFESGAKEFTFTLRGKVANDEYGKFDLAKKIQQNQKAHASGNEINQESWLLSLLMEELGIPYSVISRLMGIKLTTFKNRIYHDKFLQEDKDSMYLAVCSIFDTVSLYKDKFEKIRISGGMVLIEDKTKKEFLRSLEQKRKEDFAKAKRLEWAGVEGYDEEGRKLSPPLVPETKFADRIIKGGDDGGLKVEGYWEDEVSKLPKILERGFKSIKKEDIYNFPTPLPPQVGETVEIKGIGERDGIYEAENVQDTSNGFEVDLKKKEDFVNPDFTLE